MDQSDLRIVLLGKTGSGKSSAGNTILGRDYFKKTVSPMSTTETCEKQDVEIDGRTISVVDTPGIFDTKTQKSKEELKKCVFMSAPGPHAFLLVIRLDVKYTDEEKTAVKRIQESFGEEAASYTIILFTHDDALDGKPINDYIRESDDLQAVVRQCRHRFHTCNNKNTENRSQVIQLLEKIDKMVKENEGQYYTNEMYKQAQSSIEWEEFKKKLKYYGKTALTVIGGAVVVGTGAAAVAGAGPITVAVGTALAAAKARFGP